MTCLTATTVACEPKSSLMTVDVQKVAISRKAATPAMAWILRKTMRFISDSLVWVEGNVYSKLFNEEKYSEL